MKERIVVAMSGGVDSSSAAGLLKEAGYDVIGITMKLWNQNSTTCDDKKSCCSPEDIKDARAVADKLKIPHYVVNLEKEFKNEVVDPFVFSYINGFTPNPCIVCNEKIKFHYLLKKAKMLGASKVATGHYATIVTKNGGTYLLKKGIDPTKDQSYFLFNLTQKQLSHIMFPLGRYTKDKIRDIAKSMDLPVAAKKESQEICFVPDNDYSRLIRDLMPDCSKEEGNIENIKGEVIGRHKGIFSYTIGQRKGLGISNPSPLYVLDINKEKNIIVAGDECHLLKKEVRVQKVNWLYNCLDNKETDLFVQIRYRHTPKKATIVKCMDDEVKVLFHKEQKAITPGQAAVFYNEFDEVVGGGWIG